MFVDNQQICATVLRGVPPRAAHNGAICQHTSPAKCVYLTWAQFVCDYTSRDHFAVLIANMPNTGNYVTALEGKSSYVNAKKMTYYGFSKSPCQKCAFNCRSSWAKRKERRVEERDITTPPPRQKTYLMLRIRRRRLGVVGQRTSKESSANVRTVVPVSRVTFRAFSADIDRVSRTVSSLVALVDWRWDQADCYNWTARLVLKGELWLVYNLEGVVCQSRWLVHAA